MDASPGENHTQMLLAQLIMLTYDCNRDAKKTFPIRLWELCRHLDPHGEERDAKEDADSEMAEIHKAWREEIDRQREERDNG